MKKIIAYSLIFIYSFMVVKPVVPYAYDFVAKKVWAYSHCKQIKEMNVHMNILEALADMAKHNNPKPVDDNPFETYKTSGNNAFDVASTFSISLVNDIPAPGYFSHYMEHLYFVFQRNDTPPPRLA